MRDRAAAVHVPGDRPARDRDRARRSTAGLEEPLRLIEDIVMSDQPYTKIVTADYTMANGDDRRDLGPAAHRRRRHVGAHARSPMAARRSASSRRTRSSIAGARPGFNYNRGRANVISRALLCHDFLASDIVDRHVGRPVGSRRRRERGRREPVVRRLSPDARSARELPVHVQAPDRAGQVDSVSADVLLRRRPSNRWRTTNKRPPMFFGQDTGGTGMTAASATRSPTTRGSRRAPRRASRRTSPRSPQSDVSAAWIARLQKAFVDSNYSAKQLAKAIVLSDEFRISHDTDATARRDDGRHAEGRGPSSCSACCATSPGFNWSTNSDGEAARHSVRPGEPPRGRLHRLPRARRRHRLATS